MDKEKIEEMLKLDLFKELGLGDVDKETLEGLADDAAYIIVRGAWMKIFEALNPDKREEFSNMLDSTPEDVDGILAFLKTEVPDYEDIIKAEIANYKSIMLAK